MDQVNPEAEDVIKTALEDAGLDPGGVHVVVVDAYHDPAVAGQMPVVYLPPGVPVDDEQLPMTEDEANELRRSRARHRIGVCGRTETPALLGPLRWALEQALQDEAFHDVWEFAWTVVADGAVGKAHGGRPGSGVMHNVLPQVRDANLAAERLVSGVLGPQVGSFRGPFGTLFRQKRDFGGKETLPARAVIVAAIYKPWLDQSTGDPATTAAFVAQAHPQAEDWWGQLIADPMIQHVSGVIELLAPTDEDLEKASAPAEAWRPLAHLIDRALDHGLEVLAEGH